MAPFDRVKLQVHYPKTQSLRILFRERGRVILIPAPRDVQHASGHPLIRAGFPIALKAPRMPATPRTESGANALTGAQACYLAYSRPGWSSTAVATTGNTLTLTPSITFTSSFGGNRIIHVAARDVNEANNTGWDAMGTRTPQ